MSLETFIKYCEENQNYQNGCPSCEKAERLKKRLLKEPWLAGIPRYAVSRDFKAYKEVVICSGEKVITVIDLVFIADKDAYLVVAKPENTKHSKNIASNQLQDAYHKIKELHSILPAMVRAFNDRGNGKPDIDYIPRPIDDLVKTPPNSSVRL